MRPTWTLLSNHGAALILVARERAVTAQSLAIRLGIGVRSVQRILRDLEMAGYFSKRRVGRSNHYEVDLHLPLRHRGLETLPLGEVFRAFVGRKLEDDSTPAMVRRGTKRRHAS